MHRRRRTALLLSAAAVAAAPLLTACGSDARPGAAAVVGDDRITVAQLEHRVNEVRSAQRAAVPDDRQYEQVIAKTGSLTRNTLHTMVLDRVLHRAARDAGVSVTRKEIQTTRAEMTQQAGGRKALEAGWLQQYSIAPKRLDDSIRTEIEARKLSAKLGADMTSKAGQDTFWAALSKASKKLDVDVNPRYGTWDTTQNKRVDTKTPWLREAAA
ncbi:Chaperone SurA [Streptomyces sp. YIM 121038]|uniref:SurA N-terminal domain-containing protein n=1 Tax=Streptomyces sp. YIM 121038 TaxID=2136401 RepID=UPI001110A887|nr:SurA N-terminal domain-containing protein [Streptomyces sp. YIM 121038]QCX77084.1 Chaperone SurA [Streptomyces sp. YIM 121038]